MTRVNMMPYSDLHPTARMERANCILFCFHYICLRKCSFINLFDHLNCTWNREKRNKTKRTTKMASAVASATTTTTTWARTRKATCVSAPIKIRKKKLNWRRNRSVTRYLRQNEMHSTTLIRRLKSVSLERYRNTTNWFSVPRKRHHDIRSW